MLISLYFAFSPYLGGLDNIKENPNIIFQQLNSTLIFMGLAVSFSALQDTSKTQNKLSKDVWENPKKGKFVIIMMSLTILLFLVLGIIGYLFTVDGILKELSIGLIILGLGMFGFLKAAIEMFENHRKDKII